MTDDDIHRAHQRVGRDLLIAQLAVEVLRHCRRGHGHVAVEDLAGRAVDADDVTLVHHRAVCGDEVVSGDVEFIGAAHRSLAHAARNDGRVRRLATAGGEDADRGHHARQVIGVRLATNEDDRLALGGECNGTLGGEGTHAHCGTRRCRDARGELRGAVVRCEAREHEVHQLLAAHALQRLIE